MTISYGVTVCNEFTEIQRLIKFLLEKKRVQDNIVVLYDSKNGDPEVESFLRSHSINGEFAWHKAEFNNHFADWKNKLTSLCTGDIIVNLDADEIPNENLINTLPELLEDNQHVDMFFISRINTITGLTDGHIVKWGWRVNDKGYVNYPDWQSRIYKNNKVIKWRNKVHEVLEGYNSFAYLPQDEEFALYHPKTIQRQEKQNEFYSEL